MARLKPSHGGSVVPLEVGAMFAVVVRESGDARQIDESADLVQASVVPRVREAPGFVSAVFTSDGAGRTLNIITFASEAAAQAALGAARATPRPPFLGLVSAEVVRVLATG
jgi:hypothetical protein